MKLIDTHVHLNDKRFADDVAETVARANKVGVYQMINVGSDYDSSCLALAQAQKYKGVFAAVGVHPHHAAACQPTDLAKIRQMFTEDKVVALGEIGLDYHYDFSPRPIQQAIFDQQLNLAAEADIPVIIHDRDAHQDVCELLAKYRGRVHGVLHCYSGSVEMAKQLLDMGYYISIAGPVTFKNSRKLPDVVRYVPMDRLLVETDCPYLAPMPHRGKRNEPAYVLEIARKVAELRSLSLDVVVEQVTANAHRLFRIGDAHA